MVLIGFGVVLFIVLCFNVLVLGDKVVLGFGVNFV